jgi:hypothetical protein
LNIILIKIREIHRLVKNSLKLIMHMKYCLIQKKEGNMINMVKKDYKKVVEEVMIHLICLDRNLINNSKIFWRRRKIKRRTKRPRTSY